MSRGCGYSLGRAARGSTNRKATCGPAFPTIIAVQGCRPVPLAHVGRSRSGSLAMLAAIRLASSWVSWCAAARRPGSSSKYTVSAG
jgi:hypothetical protein